MKNLIMHSDTEILGGIPVFFDTRVPVRILLEYFEGGDSIDDFLTDYPSVSKNQALSFLELVSSKLNIINDESVA